MKAPRARLEQETDTAHLGEDVEIACGGLADLTEQMYASLGALQRLDKGR